MRIAQGQHRATPETPILGPIHRAPKIEVLWLTDMIPVHAQAALVHKLSGAHENIVNNFGHVHGRSVINAIPLRNSPTILVLGTIACKRRIARQPVEFLRMNGSSYGGRTCFILTGAPGQSIAIGTI